LKKGVPRTLPQKLFMQKNLPQKQKVLCVFLPQNDSFGQWVFFFVKLFSFSEKKKV
jgi:hypothetical protein